MNGGSPPTAPNALAGLFTPPGITRQARRKASWLLESWKPGFEAAGVLGLIEYPENVDSGVCMISRFVAAGLAHRFLRSRLKDSRQLPLLPQPFDLDDDDPPEHERSGG
jgi:hypothetical protein